MPVFPDPESGGSASGVLRRVLPLLLLAALLVDPAAAQSFHGTFAGDGMMLTLLSARGRYNGTLIHDREFYSVDAQEVEGQLHGTFATNRGAFGFRAYFVEQTLSFETDGIVFKLRRTGQGHRGEAEPAEEELVVAETSEAEPVVAQPVGAAPAAAPVMAQDDAEERDDRLVGAWAREPIVSDSGSDFAAAILLELAADGAYTFAGGSPGRHGRWRTGDRTLSLLPDGVTSWRPYCRYLVVADSLLCTISDDARQLWHRQERSSGRAAFDRRGGSC